MMILMPRIDLKHFSGIILCFYIATSFSFGQRSVSNEITEHWNLPYIMSSNAEQDSIRRLNLVLPKNHSEYPLLVWVGGGAWSYVDRNMEMDLARKFAKQGIGFASVGHRLSAATWRDSTLSTGVRHPAHVQDLASSVKWLCDQALAYGYSTDKIFVGGYSSGAHLAALLALDHVYLNELGLESSVLKGVIPISGTYDIVNYHEVFRTGERPELAELHVEAVFGDTLEAFQNASPVSYLDNLSIPMLLISDNAIDRYTRLFERRLKKTDYTDYRILYVPDLNHGQLWRNLSFEDHSIYRSEMISFIEELSHEKNR